MDVKEAEESGADRKQERKEQGYENSWGQVSKKTLRLLRYGDTIKDEGGWAKLSTLRDRGLMIAKERMRGLSKGKGGGGKIMFEMAKEENAEESKIRLIIREGRRRGNTRR